MLQSFRALAENYSVIFFDAYGVLKNFEGVIDGVVDVLAELKRRRQGAVHRHQRLVAVAHARWVSSTCTPSWASCSRKTA